MPPKRRHQRNSRKQKTKSSFAKWFFLIITAIIVYKAADTFFPHLAQKYFSSDQKRSATETHRKKDKAQPKKQKAQKAEIQTNKTEEKEEEKLPYTSWSYENAQKFLPQKSIQDNFYSTPTLNNKGLLLAHAFPIPGKKPDPKGERNTRPGIRYVFWDGKKYQENDLKIEQLQPALGSQSAKKLVGIPKVKPKNFLGDSKLFATQLFFTDSAQKVLAVIVLNDQGAHWAELAHASGKKIPAAFLFGTTRDKTRNIKELQRKGKSYLVIENGELDEFRPYAGYQWNIQAYSWDGNRFVFDAGLSKELTQEKQMKK